MPLFTVKYCLICKLEKKGKNNMLFFAWTTNNHYNYMIYYVIYFYSNTEIKLNRTQNARNIIIQYELFHNLFFCGEFYIFISYFPLNVVAPS